VFLIALLTTAPDLGRFADHAVRIDRLIEQLGSPIYAERGAASRELDQLGEPALEPLRKASEASCDSEIRRRAERLVKVIEPRVIEARALAIRKCQLTPEEKGRRLKTLIKVGMSNHEVHHLLGVPSCIFSSGHWCTAVYSEYGLMIAFWRNKVESVDQVRPKR
jgi:hypothetical protein